MTRQEFLAIALPYKKTFLQNQQNFTEQAEDLFLEALEEIIQNQSYLVFSRKSDVIQAIHRIARCDTINQYNVKKRRDELTRDRAGNLRNPVQASAEEKTILRLTLEKILLRLPWPWGKVIWDKHAEDLSEDELQEKYGISRKTIREKSREYLPQIRSWCLAEGIIYKPSKHGMEKNRPIRG